MKNKWKNRCTHIGALLVTAICAMHAQMPNPPVPKVGKNATVTASAAAVRISREDPTVVKRGGILFVANCGFCHGATAKGTDIAPDLIRSKLVEDDDKTNLIGPVLRTGHPKGGQKPDLTDQQISDIAAWLRAQIYGAAFRQTYTYLDALVGDPKKGAAYFNANCSTCHSATSDLAGIGAKYDVPTLQFRWLIGGGGGRERGAMFSANGSMIADTEPPKITKSTTTITVTPASGKSFTGVPVFVTDFNVAFRDMSGAYHSYSRHDGFPKVEIHNPLQRHTEMLKTLKDDDMHDVTAYLVTLK